MLVISGCLIKGLDGTVVYTSVKNEKTDIVKKEKAVMRPNFNFQSSEVKNAKLYAGIRRSVYGLSKRNGQDSWWAMRAQEFATSMNQNIDSLNYVQPVIIQIVSGYCGDGTTLLQFAKPKKYDGKLKNCSFGVQNEIDHERALSIYDQYGVSAIIQFESGNSDVLENIEIAHQKFGHHPCIIGYGVDAEWYFTKESSDETGMPVTDIVASKWMEKVLSLNPDYTLFLKHWDPTHMPRHYRHKNLWFLSDTQIFDGLDEIMDDFSLWAANHRDQVVGYQYGYPKDEKWWKLIKYPTVTIGKRIYDEIPMTRFLFWVDFTADYVEF